MPPKKIKLSDLATELHLTSEVLLEKISEAGIKISARVKTFSEEEAEALRQYLQKKGVSLTEVRKGDIVEKRVQTSVIRRRKVEPPPPAAPVVPEPPKKEVSKPAPAKVLEEIKSPAPASQPSGRVKPKINVIVEEKPKPKSPEVALSAEEIAKQK
ncbi:MAG: translation initiation factor IF-2 N-terminal domain-containing protein, partial [Deltaproteobacteria bacterium]|nr:translation initiation factor IF-2 N-terminal domain-containing protein [Deltaproteobacteria bacterium]